MLIVNAEIEGHLGQDVRFLGGIIREIGPDLARRPEEDIVDARGGALLPGLNDHHLHLFALAAAESSVRCGPPEVTNKEELAAALARPGSGWVRGTGYHQSVAGDLTRMTWTDGCRTGPYASSTAVARCGWSTPPGRHSWDWTRSPTSLALSGTLRDGPPDDSSGCMTGSVPGWARVPFPTFQPFPAD